MSISTRIEAIEQHLTDDYNVLEVAGADLTNVDKNILNLKTTWQERLLYFMNNGTDVVWNNWDKVIGEGTSISLNNTLEGKMKINLKGNTSQETTTGKNLLPITLTSQTKNNVVFTVNSDNSITLNQTSNAGITINLNYTSGKYISLTSGETYTLSIKNNIGVYVRLSKVSDNSVVASIDSPNKQITFTSNYTGDCFVYLAILNNTSFNNLTIYPMLEKGSTVSTYEPYTNGASPNPDYPQPIQVVSGDNSIEVGNGKNIFNMKEYASANSSYFTYSSSTGLTAIAKDNRATANVGYPIEVDTNTTYYIKTDTDKRLLIAQFNSNNVWITNNEAFNGDSFKPNANASYIRVKVADTLTSFPTVLGNVYISTSSDYTGESYPISLGDIELCKIGTYQDKIDKSSGKNLFDNSKAQIGKAWNNASNTARAIVLTKVKPSTTYYLSYLNKSAVDDIYWFDRENENDSTYITGNTQITQPLSITTKSNCNYLGIQFNKTSITQEDINKVGIMLNEGSTALEYEPYGTGWYVKKEIQKTVITSDNVSNLVVAVSDAGYGKYANILKSAVGYKTAWGSNYTLMNTYKEITATSQATDGTFATNFQQAYITIINSQFTDITTARNLLIGTEIYIIKDTPTYTIIEDSTLIEELESMKKSKEGQTNISQTNDDLPFIINATALKEMA